MRGGLGFGEWVEGHSDVDFFATLGARPGPDEIAALRRAHELARHGVTVTGPPLETLGIWTDDAVLRELTLDNLDTYWRSQAEGCVASPDGAATPFDCEWVVPGVARLHHLLVTGRQTAKSLAVRWGLGFYPERWHRVLRESLAVRRRAPLSRSTTTPASAEPTSPPSRRTSWSRGWRRAGSSRSPRPSVLQGFKGVDAFGWHRVQ